MQDLTILTLLKRLQDKVNSVSKQIGPKGDQGPAGKDGVSIKGEKGDTGEMGVGQDGRDGDEGPSGRDGEDGVGISGVTLGIDDSIIFQLSNGDEASVELPLIQGSGDTIINRVNGGSGATTSIAPSTPFGGIIIEDDTVTTTNGSWTELARHTMAANTDEVITFEIHADRTDQTGHFLGIFMVYAYSDGTTANIVEGMEELVRFTDEKKLKVRESEDGLDLVFEVQGKNNQTWAWDFRDFVRTAQ